MPFDTRLESIDTCEQVYRETATRYSTGEIGLARHREGLELIRIGPAMRPEFVAWRYGEQYRRRRRKAIALASVGAVGVGAGLVVLGVAAAAAVGATSTSLVVGLGQGAFHAVTHGRTLKVIEPDNHKPVTLNQEGLLHTMVTWEADDPVMEVPVGIFRATKHLRLQGHEFLGQGRRILGSFNSLSGSPKDLDLATRLLGERGGDLVPWLREVTLRDARIGGPNASWRFPGNLNSERAREFRHPYLLPGLLARHERLALEMWMNEDIERIWLEGELKLLEREWREADRVAKIADDLALKATGQKGTAVS